MTDNKMDENHFGVATDSLSLEIVFRNKGINPVARFKEDDIKDMDIYCLVFHKDQEKQVREIINNLPDRSIVKQPKFNLNEEIAYTEKMLKDYPSNVKEFVNNIITDIRQGKFSQKEIETQFLCISVGIDFSFDTKNSSDFFNYYYK